ncbi:MAG: hypothetical protein ACKVOP_08020 [Sphingomonadaceae bacterium]
MTDPDLVGRTGAPSTRDYFAEMYVAGLLADAGWDIYFPRRDKGFDMVVSRPVAGGSIVRPVQVKGKYSTDKKIDKARYGFVGKLTALHDDMILAVPFFTSSDASASGLIAWAPRFAIKASAKGFAFEPATFVAGKPQMRRDFKRYFADEGLRALATSN